MAAPMPRLPPVTITIPVAAVAAPFLFRISYARSRYVNLRYLLPTFCGLDSKPDRVERWKKYQGQKGSHSRSADQCIGERSPKCREREWDEGQDPASAVSTTGLERWTVASTRAWNESRPSSRFVLICPIRMSVFRIRIPASAIKPRMASKPNG